MVRERDIALVRFSQRCLVRARTISPEKPRSSFASAGRTGTLVEASLPRQRRFKSRIWASPVSTRVMLWAFLRGSPRARPRAQPVAQEGIGRARARPPRFTTHDFDRERSATDGTPATRAAVSHRAYP